METIKLCEEDAVAFVQALEEDWGFDETSFTKIKQEEDWGLQDVFPPLV